MHEKKCPVPGCDFSTQSFEKQYVIIGLKTHLRMVHTPEEIAKLDISVKQADLTEKKERIKEFVRAEGDGRGVRISEAAKKLGIGKKWLTRLANQIDCVERTRKFLVPKERSK
ncbi:hypothetical protein AKJ53_01480 [candidate division MSBL1 archaeon SCGC-AAA382F02]|uniref:Uncharacterized protein n=1 Tax=candidate division MSBL1 archaeon SCGC-AAA382F02 TaxID=1698282 RepID=A0A133VHT6_9EURY|nr:hypothetical protein AKJ53_01480 [candidate division MSBL1 archaeon SCGC-AAA382F02]